MRAPADSTKPITGTRERSASSSTDDDGVGMRLAQRAARERGVLREDRDDAPVDAPARAEHTIAGTRLLSHAAREHLGAQQVERPGSQSTSRRSSGDSRSSGRGTRASVMLPPDRARCCGRRSRTSWRSRSRAGRRPARALARASGHVVEVEVAGRARLEAERRRDQLCAQGEDRRDASTAPAAPSRCPIADLVEEIGTFAAYSPSAGLERDASRRDR